MKEVTSQVRVALVTIAMTSLIIAPAVHAESGSNSGPGRKLPDLKSLEKLSSRSGDFIKKQEDRFATRSEKLRELKDKIASRAGELEHKFASLSGKLKEDRTTRVSKVKENLALKFSNITARQENILKRANSRIASLSAEGKNVTEVKAKADAVATAIAKQKAAIAGLTTSLDKIASASSDTTTNVGSAVSAVVKQIGQTQKSLQDLINAIRKLSPASEKHSGSPKATAQPSSSPTVSPIPSPTDSSL